MFGLIIWVGLIWLLWVLPLIAWPLAIIPGACLIYLFVYLPNKRDSETEQELKKFKEEREQARKERQRRAEGMAAYWEDVRAGRMDRPRDGQTAEQRAEELGYFL